MSIICLMLCAVISQKTEAIEKPVEEPKTLKMGKGKLPDDEDTRDGATLKPVIVEPEVSHIFIYIYRKFLNF